jgi:hypothetical protein
MLFSFQPLPQKAFGDAIITGSTNYPSHPFLVHDNNLSFRKTLTVDFLEQLFSTQNLAKLTDENRDTIRRNIEAEYQSDYRKTEENDKQVESFISFFTNPNAPQEERVKGLKVIKNAYTLKSFDLEALVKSSICDIICKFVNVGLPSPNEINFFGENERSLEVFQTDDWTAYIYGGDPNAEDAEDIYEVGEMNLTGYFSIPDRLFREGAIEFTPSFTFANKTFCHNPKTEQGEWQYGDSRIIGYFYGEDGDIYWVTTGDYTGAEKQWETKLKDLITVVNNSYYDEYRLCDEWGDKTHIDEDMPIKSSCPIFTKKYINEENGCASVVFIKFVQA